jgi:hypothetical protein
MSALQAMSALPLKADSDLHTKTLAKSLRRSVLIASPRSGWIGAEGTYVDQGRSAGRFKNQREITTGRDNKLFLIEKFIVLSGLNSMLARGRNRTMELMPAPGGICVGVRPPFQIYDRRGRGLTFDPSTPRLPTLSPRGHVMNAIGAGARPCPGLRVKSGPSRWRASGVGPRRAAPA